jgi:TrmH family RNA methyltransferase
MIRRAGSLKGRRRSGLYAIEGTRLVERALRAGVPLRAALVAQRLASDTTPRSVELLTALRSACPVIVAPDAVITKLTEGRDLGPLLALVELPVVPSLDHLLAGAAGGSPTLLVAFDILDPGNVGALARTAHASGAAALLTSGASDAFHPRATRISRGSIFKLPIIHYDTGAALLDDLGRCGVRTIGTVASGGMALPTVELPPAPLAVLMGNEAEGLPPAVQQRLDVFVTIPMPDGIDSFSVNAAAAIVLYELGRRRQA